jgi:hypothetical protein
MTLDCRSRISRSARTVSPDLTRSAPDQDGKAYSQAEDDHFATLAYRDWFLGASELAYGTKTPQSELTEWRTQTGYLSFRPLIAPGAVGSVNKAFPSESMPLNNCHQILHGTQDI